MVILTPDYSDALNAQCLVNLAHKDEVIYWFNNNLQAHFAIRMDFTLRRIAEKYLGVSCGAFLFAGNSRRMDQTECNRP